MPVLLSRSNTFMASLALILSVVAVLLVVAMRTTPCANAQSGSCAVGDTEIFASSVTVNEDGNDADTRFEGDTDQNLFYLDAGNDRIGLGTSAPSVFFDVRGISSFGDNNITNVGDIAVDSLSADGGSIVVQAITSFDDNNITNVGDIALDSISADGAGISVSSDVDFGNNDLTNLGNANTDITSTVAQFGVTVEAEGVDTALVISSGGDANERFQFRTFNTQGVTTSPVTIGPPDQGTGTGIFAMVVGREVGGGSARFADLVFYSNTLLSTVDALDFSNGPDARTYTSAAGSVLTLQMAANTYNVSVLVIIGANPT